MTETLADVADEFARGGWTVQMQHRGVAGGDQLVIREHRGAAALIVQPRGRYLEVWLEHAAHARQHLGTEVDTTGLRRRAAVHLAPRRAAVGSDGVPGAGRTNSGVGDDRGAAMPLVVVSVLVFLVVVAACGKGLSWPDPPPEPSTHSRASGAAVGDVSSRQLRAALSDVDVVDTPPEATAEYDRGEFGPDWTDEHHGVGGHNDCNTRDDILARDLKHVEYEAGSDCEVASGVLADPYTGERIEFDADIDPSAVQIEHIYPLSLSWDRGASTWSEQKRIEFANDQRRNLIAVDGPANMSKGDAPPAEWLPPNPGFRCDYLYRFLKVGAHYDLPITEDDAAAVREQSAHCVTGGDHRD